MAAMNVRLILCGVHWAKGRCGVHHDSQPTDNPPKGRLVPTGIKSSKQLKTGTTQSRSGPRCWGGAVLTGRVEEQAHHWLWTMTLTIDGLKLCPSSCDSRPQETSGNRGARRSGRSAHVGAWATRQRRVPLIRKTQARVLVRLHSHRRCFNGPSPVPVASVDVAPLHRPCRRPGGRIYVRLPTGGPSA